MADKEVGVFFLFSLGFGFFMLIGIGVQVCFLCRGICKRKLLTSHVDVQTLFHCRILSCIKDNILLEDTRMKSL